MSKDNEDIWQYDTSYYSASNWGFEKQSQAAKKLREKLETDEELKERHKAAEKKRLAAAEKQRIENEKRRAEEKERAEARRLEQEAEERQREEQERIAAERAAALAKIAEEHAEELRKAEEEKRLAAEREFNSPKTVGGITIPAPTDQDKKWYQAIIDRTFIPQFARENLEIQSLWQFHQIIEHDKLMPDHLGYLYLNAAQNPDTPRHDLLKHFKFSITHDYNHALRLAFERDDRPAFDQLLEWGAGAENALLSSDMSGFKCIKFAQYAGITQYHWEKQDDQTILRRHYETDEDDIITVRTSFNFSARKIRTHILVNDRNPCVYSEGFQAQENDIEIAEAFKKLKEMKGNPAPYDIIVKTARKERGATTIPEGFTKGKRP